MLKSWWCRLLGHAWVFTQPAPAVIQSVRNPEQLAQLYLQAIRCDRCERTELEVQAGGLTAPRVARDPA